jgi:hypothetical protein
LPAALNPLRCQYGVNASPSCCMMPNSQSRADYPHQIVIRPARDQLWPLVIGGTVLAAIGAYETVGKPSAWPVVALFVLAWLVAGAILQSCTITIDHGTLTFKELFRETMTIRRTEVSNVELRFSTFQHESMSPSQNEIWISRVGHKPVTLNLKPFTTSDAQTIVIFFGDKISNRHDSG